ncbi:MAG TPA: hypothetical protein DCQ26_02425 [Marinilabiliales bacterium]|nr:MAG: hypothetical protein A2W95_15935 [Bacteroidetes bacterium GWA2_40_14]OFX58418.1 MAG: hypothetical protein A2W84_10185 [Bacteroidetes bacterium GWC2_40_13]OFX71955.1 MAG: hypothetical protein A2W96_03270 [Bacteroidetes bacterium GWD2_40_43]OFX89466.1 MAG: hypothetical protein A2W97_14020 [Bacteroidetes bacterium GWE2_40_63]OFY23291.1 MAG: hypothetical protein A2W88_19680 [Bacteroidetes bacterium GWF2_40_13]OFZ28098.1 MAG: hypothetical protein A2437_04310 [Bacteroidetes bacterium RIFOXYC
MCRISINYFYFQVFNSLNITKTYRFLIWQIKYSKAGCYNFGKSLILNVRTIKIIINWSLFSDINNQK